MELIAGVSLAFFAKLNSANAIASRETLEN
jgi:hypothetical protein